MLLGADSTHQMVLPLQSLDLRLMGASFELKDFSIS